MNKKLFFGISAGIILAVVGLLIYGFELSPVIVEGVVDHKTVIGVKDNVSYTLLVNKPAYDSPWILVKDKDYVDYFSTGYRNAIVSKPLENEMKKKYSDIAYFVNIKVSSKEETQPYQVSREIFNKLRINSKVKFEQISFTEPPTIVKVLEVAEDRWLPFDLAAISKQNRTVQSYLEHHLNAKYEIRKWYLTSDGRVYAVDKNWKIEHFIGSVGPERPIDNRNHYCWVVHWYDPNIGIPHIVDVFIDKETLEIVLAVEAW